MKRNAATAASLLVGRASAQVGRASAPAILISAWWGGPLCPPSSESRAGTPALPVSEPHSTIGFSVMGSGTIPQSRSSRSPITRHEVGEMSAVIQLADAAVSSMLDERYHCKY